MVRVDERDAIASRSRPHPEEKHCDGLRTGRALRPISPNFLTSVTRHAVRVAAIQWSVPVWPLGGVPGLPTALPWLPGRGSHAVALPVSDRVWRMWRARDVMGASAIFAGATFGGIGRVAGVGGLVTFGAFVGILAVIYRTRAHHDYRVTCRFRPAEQTIVVEPTHPRFDEAARDLFVRSLR